jgi:hypothetical protein
MKTLNEMTAEELLQTPFIPHTIGYIIALRDKLREAITPVNIDRERELHYLVHADYFKKQ